jgi:Tol biopolymer transport system component
MPLAPGSRLGPYEILAQIGAGGMGEVYRAKDARLGRDVAIKVLPASFSEDAERLRRFEQEAKAAGVLNHPNVTAVYDIGTDSSGGSGGAPYVVQELLEGETLRSVLAGGKLSARKTIDYSLQIVRGLAAAHEKGIVHRDLKPENVFVTNDGRVKILDFGLAKLTQAEGVAGNATNLPTETCGTEPGVVMGTLGYMSPEQVRGRPTDARSDIFAFGAILYEMLSGRRAFHPDTAADTMSAILKEDPPDLSLTNQSVSPGLERIVRHCLEKNPEQRFHSAHDLAFDLESLSSASGQSAGALAVAGAGRRAALRLPLALAVALALGGLAAGYLVGHRASPAAQKTSSLTYSQLTFLPHPIFNARFSPDGKTVIYSAAPSGNAPQIFSIKPDYPGVPPTGQPGMELLSVSSKGELAVLTKPRYLRHSLFIGTLARMPLEGGAPREIVDFVREADWNPDGSELAVIRDVNGKDRLEYPLGKVLAETGGYLSNPRFSPRGDRIAFFEHPFKYDDRGSVAVVDLAGKKTILSDGYGVEEGLAWSRDGREVLFSGGPDYFNIEVYAVGLDGKRRSAAQSAGGITILDVAADGRWLVSRDEAWRDMFGRGPGQEKERNLSWLELSYPVAITPDGKTLVFAEESGRVGKYYSTCMRQMDGSPVVRLGDGTPLDISRDGKLVISSVPTDPAQLVVYSTGAGQPRKLERGAIVSYEAGGFFPDGQRIFACGHEAGHAVQCYVQDLAGGAPRPITPEGTTTAPEGTTNGLISPDGTQMLVTNSSGALIVFPVAGGAPRPVLGTSPDDAALRWMSDGKSILLANHWWEVPLHVQKLDLATGRREDVATLRPGELTGAVQIVQAAFTGDGKSYAYAVRRMASHLFLVGKGE